MAVPSGRAARPDAASSVAPVEVTTGAPCVLASERPSHPDDEQRPAKPSPMRRAFLALLAVAVFVPAAQAGTPTKPVFDSHGNLVQAPFAPTVEPARLT